MCYFVYGIEQGCQMMPNLANTTVFHTFANTFMPKFCHFLKYQLSVLTKQSISDYLSNEYANFREKIQLNINICELLYHSAGHPPISANHSY